MRIAVALEYLEVPNGAATYAHVLAQHLQRLGHDTSFVTNHRGAMSELIEESAIPVAEDLGAPPDIVIAHDPIIAADLAARWPAAPQVFVAHSAELDQGLPPQVAGLTAAVIAMNDRVATRVGGHAAQPRVVRLRQPIDTQRFRRRAALPERPRRVLMLGNYLVGERRDAVRSACEEQGLEVDQIGEHGRQVTDPEHAIARSHVVIAYGRAALEAMSCARAVYVLDMVSADGWVDEESYAAMESNGFAGFARPGAFSPERLAADLAAYHPRMGEVNRDLVLRHHGAQVHAGAVAQLCMEVAGSFERLAQPDELAVLMRNSWNSEWRTRGLARQLQASDAHAEHLDDMVRAERGRRAQAERQAHEWHDRFMALQASRRHRLGAALLKPLDRLRRR